MPMFAIMDKEHKSYSMTGNNSVRWYNENPKMHISGMYAGFQLVEMQTYKSGFKFTFRFMKDMFSIKPDFGNKYCRYFHWLWFILKFEYEFSERFFKVIKDWSEEARLKQEQISKTVVANG
jgi:hypothetical protein